MIDYFGLRYLPQVPPQCPGVGKPVFLDYGGPAPGVVSRCSVCGLVIKPNTILGAPPHEAPPPETPL